MVLKKLDQKQTKLLKQVQEEYVNHYLNSGYETTYETLRPLIDWCYEKTDLKCKHPTILIADGFVSQKLMINYYLQYFDQVGDQVWDQVGRQVWGQVWDQIEHQVGDQVVEQVRKQVWDQVVVRVQDQVRDQVQDQIRNQVRDQVGNQVGNQVVDQVEEQVKNQVEEQVGKQILKQVLGQVLGQVGIQVRNQVGNQVGNQIRKQVGDQVRDQVRSQVWQQVVDQVVDQVGDQVWGQVRDQVGNQVGNQIRKQAWGQVVDQVEEQVRSQVRDQVRNQVGDQVRDQVRSQVWQQVVDQVVDQVGDQVEDQVVDQVENQELKFYEQWFGCWDAGWLAFYDFFRKIGIVQSEDFEKYNQLQREAFSIVFFETFVVVCKLPKKTHLSPHGLHNTNGPAIEWRDGINTTWSIHGITFSDESKLFDDGKLYWDIVKRRLSAKDILKIQNIEQRRVAINHYGMDKIFADLDKKLISRQSKKIPLWEEKDFGKFYQNPKYLPKKTKEITYELYKVFNIVPDIDLLVVRYEDPSTNREYISQVPDTNIYDDDEPIDTAMKAMAWKSQMSLDEYMGLKIEA